MKVIIWLAEKLIVSIREGRAETMLTNRILKFLLIPIGFLLFIPEIVTTFCLSFLLLLFIPPIGLIYVFIMTMVWLPFWGLIIGTSWLYQKVPILGIPLSLIGIPFVIIIDIFLQLMPNPDKKDKYNKSVFCMSFPFSLPSQLVGKLMMD